ncbi:MAG: hypothetical protein HYT87_13485 [Nitrospirae bacterium]|nr:hypothetical protein [Nitrospirota bacterium]
MGFPSSGTVGVIRCGRSPALTRGLDRYVAAPLRVEVLKGLGHWTQQEAPEEVNRLLAGFFAEK